MGGALTLPFVFPLFDSLRFCFCTKMCAHLCVLSEPSQTQQPCRPRLSIVVRLLSLKGLHYINVLAMVQHEPLLLPPPHVAAAVIPGLLSPITSHRDSARKRAHMRMQHVHMCMRFHVSDRSSTGTSRSREI